MDINHNSMAWALAIGFTALLSACAGHGHHRHDHYETHVYSDPAPVHHDMVADVGVTLVFERDLGCHSLRGRPHHYFYADHYVRRHQGGWQIARNAHGPWRRAHVEQLPPGLHDRYAKHRVRSAPPQKKHHDERPARSAVKKGRPHKDIARNRRPDPPPGHARSQGRTHPPTRERAAHPHTNAPRIAKLEKHTSARIERESGPRSKAGRQPHHPEARPRSRGADTDRGRTAATRDPRGPSQPRHHGDSRASADAKRRDPVREPSHPGRQAAVRERPKHPEKPERAKPGRNRGKGSKTAREDEPPDRRGADRPR